MAAAESPELRIEARDLIEEMRDITGELQPREAL
jgi:hypothetical protein